MSLHSDVLLERVGNLAVPLEGSADKLDSADKVGILSSREERDASDRCRMTAARPSPESESNATRRSRAWNVRAQIWASARTTESEPAGSERQPEPELKHRWSHWSGPGSTLTKKRGGFLKLSELEREWQELKRSFSAGGSVGLFKERNVPGGPHWSLAVDLGRSVSRLWPAFEEVTSSLLGGGLLRDREIIGVIASRRGATLEIRVEGAPRGATRATDYLGKGLLGPQRRKAPQRGKAPAEGKKLLPAKKTRASLAARLLFSCKKRMAQAKNIGPLLKSTEGGGPGSILGTSAKN